MLPNIFISTNIPEKGIKLFVGKANFEVWRDDNPPEREYFLQKISNAHGVIAFPSATTNIDKEAIDAAEKLKVISCYSVGYDHIDVSYATKKGIIVTNTPGVLTDATADIAFGLILMAGRRMSEGERIIRSGNWTTWGPRFLLGRQVSGASLGIVGLGRIGQAVAKRARGFGMDLFYTGRNRKESLEKELGIKYLPFDDLIANCDFISLHCPLNSETEGMIGNVEFERMKNTAVLVNTSRSRVVDTEALYLALKNGQIAAAGVDVYDSEPVAPDCPLLELENIAMTPHIGSASHETREGMAVMAVENMLAALEGKMPPNPVNPEVFEE
jgi:glyoxylate reductase